MQLISLDLSGCGITSECLSHLKKMTTLRRVTLDKRFLNTGELAELQVALPQAQFNCY